MGVVIPNAKAPTILALETSAEFCSVALRAQGNTRSCESQAVQKHSELILPMIHELLAAAGLGIRDMDAIAFGAGPGSFTGLRIASGVVQGLAFSTGCKVVPVGSLEALAEFTGAQRVLVCTDARMGQIYYGAFKKAAQDWRVVLPPGLCDPGQGPTLPGKDWIGCGSGFDRYSALLNQQYGEQLADVMDGVIPHAREIASLGARHLLAGRSVAGAQALPIYVRNKVALTMEEQK